MKKQANRAAQYPLYSEFQFAFNDWVVSSDGTGKKTLGCAVVNATDPTEPDLLAGTAIVFDGILMPLGAVIVGGELIIDTAMAGPATATVSVGINGTPAGLLAATSIMAAAGTRTALLLTAPLICNGGTNVRLTFAIATAVATAGKARVRLQYTIDGRGQEVQSN